MTTTPSSPAPPSVPDPTTGAVGARLRALWSSGDYDRVAREVIPTLGETLVDACGVRAGQRVLDVAAGTGNAAVPAARRGADVVAADITPELLDTGRRRAEEAGVDLRWEVADAAHLPHPDASFDVVLSCVGVMFAPDHAACAAELVRVLRPGGTLGLLSWTPEGTIGRLLAAVRPFAPPPAPGAQPPPLWGREEHVLRLLGDAVTDVRTERRRLRVERFDDPAAYRAFFTAHYGPLVVLRRGLAGDPAREAAFDAVVEEVAELSMAATQGPAGAMDWEFLLLTAHRR